MALVNGTKKKKSTFFLTTKTALTRGYLFLTGDRPSESSFRNLMESIPFFANFEDRAKEEDGLSNIEDLQGLIIAANDEQVTSRQEKSKVKTWSVQPSQVSETASKEDTITIGSVSSEEGALTPYEGTDISVERDGLTSTHNKYIVSMTSALWAWLGGLFDQVQSFIPKLVPAGGTTGQRLVKASDSDFDTEWVDKEEDKSVVDFQLTSVDDFPDDADMIVWIDTSSFSGVPANDAIALATAYYNNLVSNRSTYIGKMIVIETGEYNEPQFERWLAWPSQYIDPNFTLTPTQVLQPDGNGGTEAGDTSPITVPVNTSTVQLMFIDESANAPTVYTPIPSRASLTDAPSAAWVEDYDTWTTGGSSYSQYSFFRGIVYVAQGSPDVNQANGMANLIANVVQGVNSNYISELPSTWDNSIGGTGDGPWVLAYLRANNPATGWLATDLDFLSDGSSGLPYQNYNGLSNYGFGYVVDIPSGTIGSISSGDFQDQVNLALSGGDGYNTVTLTGTIILANGEQFSSSTSFDIPV